jgi:acetoin utilization deacetylase AcuC-like enzyme
MQLTTFAFVRVVKGILGMGGPVLLVGGGGYHGPSAAKHFACVTGCVLGRELDDEIPVEAEYWEELERDGGIHVGRDSLLTTDGEKEADVLCAVLKQKLNA